MSVQPFNKFNSLLEHLAEKVHNLGADTLKVYLTNTAPNASTMAVKADLSETLTTTGGYTAGGQVASITSSAQTGGVYKLVLGDVSWTASGGGFGPFRYAVLYNDTPTSPADPLIGWWDNGASVTLVSGEAFTVDYDPAAGVLTLTGP
jgi:hypothetical protein